MSRRPIDIPEDVWESDEVLIIACMPIGSRELVCRGILAERNRIARKDDASAPIPER